MQRAPGCRRGAGPILLLALVALAAAAPRLVRAVTDAADGTLVHPLPASSARSELVPSVDYRFAAARASCSIVRSFGGGVGVACAGGLFVPALSVVLYCDAKHPGRGIGLILRGADVLCCWGAAVRALALCFLACLCFCGLQQLRERTRHPSSSDC